MKHHNQIIIDTESNLQTLESKYEDELKKLNQQLKDGKQKNSDLRDKLKENKKLYEEDKTRYERELFAHKEDLYPIQTKNEALNLKYEEKQDEINLSKARQLSYDLEKEKLQKSVSKQRQQIVRQSPIKLSNTVHMYSDDSDEEESGQTMSPVGGDKKQHGFTKPQLMMLTPTKAGITKFLPSETTFIDWLTSNESTFE